MAFTMEPLSIGPEIRQEKGKCVIIRTKEIEMKESNSQIREIAFVSLWPLYMCLGRKDVKIWRTVKCSFSTEF